MALRPVRGEVYAGRGAACLNGVWRSPGNLSVWGDFPRANIAAAVAGEVVPTSSRMDEREGRCETAKENMPFINVKLIEGVFTPAQKQEMIRKLTETMVSIEGENMRSVTSVVVEEVKSGDWGIGGKPLSTADVNALAAGKKA